MLGCVAVGQSVEEVRKLIAEAIEFHVEDLRQAGEPMLTDEMIIFRVLSLIRRVPRPT